MRFEPLLLTLPGLSSRNALTLLRCSFEISRRGGGVVVPSSRPVRLRVAACGRRTILLRAMEPVEDSASEV